MTEKLHSKGIHWLAPCLALASFTAGVLAAVGHDQFYLSLVGKRTSSSTDISVMGTQFSIQQFNLAIGNTFALLVRSTLCLATSIAFCQMFWRVVKQESASEKPPTLKRLDTAQSAISNICSFFYVRLWYRYPVLFGVAAISWLIPIAAIITPATLSVIGELQDVTSAQAIPGLDFYNLGYVAGMPASRGDHIRDQFSYAGSSIAARRVAVAVAAQGSPLPIPAPAPNSSWELQFQGPSVRCTELTPGTSRRLAIDKSVSNYVNSSGCNTPPIFLSWFRAGDLNIEPYTMSGKDSDGNPVYNFVDQWADTNETMFFVASYPGLGTPKRLTSVQDLQACSFRRSASAFGANLTSPLGQFEMNSTAIQCEVFNSTYNTYFEVLNGEQNVDITLSSPEVDQKVPTISSVMGPKGSPDECPMINTLPEYRGPDYRLYCIFDMQLMSQLSYQGALGALTALFKGNVTTNYLYTWKEQSRIRDTTLINSKELAFLSDYGFHMELGRNRDILPNDSRLDLQRQYFDSIHANLSAFSGIHDESGTTSEKPLSFMIEETFQNIVVSFMTSPALRPENASTQAEVTVRTWHTVYVYTRIRLWLAYGCAILLTLLTIVLGSFAAVGNNATYSNSFSTMLLAGHGTEFSVQVADIDKSGRDPLPSYLEKATVKLQVVSRVDEVEAMIPKPMAVSEPRSST